MDQFNAARAEPRKALTLVASTGVTRADTSTSFGGYKNFDISNRFRYYQELAVASPHVSTSLIKLGLSLTKGMHFDGDSAADVDEFEMWGTRVNFLEQVQTLARLLCRDGVYLAQTSGDAPGFRLVPLLMPAITLVSAEDQIGKGSKDIITPPVLKVVVNESDASKRTTFDIADIIYGTFNAWDGVQRDVMGRDTFGIYGTSLLDPIELPIRNLLNINHGYVSFVQKYGNGRYVFNFALLEKLVEQEIISVEDAQKAIDAWLEEHKNLKANEDIVGAGMSVVPIDANGSLDVMAFKKSLETDIQIGLFQTPLSMGDTKGSTYAAGYVSEEDRMVVLEGLQKVIQNIAQQAIDKRLKLLGKPEGNLWIEFEELSKPKLESRDVLEWFNVGVLSKEQLLEWGGFPVEGKK
ncbi:MAG: hypothetical protein Q8J68_03850 [Methanolobus sp.]|uniref:hypothetical protein n=1 Tax=Methanolobus sp. TaxID=1874737 RepID=UPI002731E5B6|nr:hypothetical protein [Methanolobus sp.]MDP2216405.1 hypothetical protein [Methanolobus sp.]